MAALQTLRDRAGVLIACFVGLALFAFILTDLFSGNALFGTSDEVGKIDGETIKIQDFQSRIDEYETFTKMNQNQASLTEDVQNQIREQVWNQLVQEITFGKQYEKAGIAVTGDELLDMATGNHISPMLRQLFTNPETGAYDRALAQNFLQNKNSDPQASFYWNFLEKNLKSDRLASKYMTAISSGIFYTDAQAQLDSAKRAKEVSLAFVPVRYNNIPDSIVAVSDAEIKARYEKDKELYKVDESRTIEYVSFPIRPTELDREDTEKAVEALIPDFSVPETDAYHFAQSAGTQAYERFMTKEQLPSVLATFVETAKEGAVFGPYRDGESYKLSRLVSIQQRPDSVKARHILIRNNAALADSLLDVVKKGGNFAEIARQYSEDQGSAINGGDLDWFNDGVMVAPFNEACFKGSKGDFVKVTSQFGEHIINIQDKGANKTKYSIATIEKPIEYSTRTQQEVYNVASQFITHAKNEAQFNAQIDSMNLVKRYGNNIRSNAQTVSTLRQARELVKWAYEAEVGDISEIEECEDEFVVALLTGVQEKGYAKVSDVSSVIARELRNEKKAAMIATETAGKTLAEVAAKYNAKEDTAEHITFGSNSIVGAGSEPMLVGAAVGTEKGGKIEALKGNNAAYVGEVLEVGAAPVSRAQAEASYMQQFQGLQYTISNYVTDVDIEDNRIRFY